MIKGGDQRSSGQEGLEDISTKLNVYPELNVYNSTNSICHIDHKRRIYNFRIINKIYLIIVMRNFSLKKLYLIVRFSSFIFTKLFIYFVK